MIKRITEAHDDFEKLADLLDEPIMKYTVSRINTLKYSKTEQLAKRMILSIYRLYQQNWTGNLELFGESLNNKITVQFQNKNVVSVSLTSGIRKVNGKADIWELTLSSDIINNPRNFSYNINSIFSDIEDVLKE
jgi:hypothetical protein